jgi:hypothetical protein
MRDDIVSSKHQASLVYTVSTAHDPLVLLCITVPSVARTFDTPLERQDLLVCNYVNQRDLKT